jgi:hypothetical protein
MWTNDIGPHPRLELAVPDAINWGLPFKSTWRTATASRAIQRARNCQSSNDWYRTEVFQIAIGYIVSRTSKPFVIFSQLKKTW